MVAPLALGSLAGSYFGGKEVALRVRAGFALYIIYIYIYIGFALYYIYIYI